MNQDIIPENFTVSLALVDAIPVLLFAVAIILLGVKAGFSRLIIAGGAICFVSGALKVLWKLLIATKEMNVVWLTRQMAPVMTVGFLLILIGCIRNWSAIKAAFASPPVVSIVFLALWAVGMLAMSVFAITMDQTSAKANWMEQATNGFSQLCLCIALANL